MRDEMFKRYAIYVDRSTSQPPTRKFDPALFADKIPAAARWVAMDATGEVYAYSHRPFIRDGANCWAFPSGESLGRYIIGIDPTGIDWTQALAPVNQPQADTAPDPFIKSVPFSLPQYQYTSGSRNDMGDRPLESRDETIDRKQAMLDVGVALLNEGREIIESLQEQLRRKNESAWLLIAGLGEIITQLIGEKKALQERVEELEAALRKERTARQGAQDAAADLRDKCHAQDLLLSTLEATIKERGAK